MPEKKALEVFFSETAGTLAERIYFWRQCENMIKCDITDNHGI